MLNSVYRKSVKKLNTELFTYFLWKKQPIVAHLVNTIQNIISYSDSAYLN